MNSTSWAHLKAFIWLRWRLAVNQTRRSGPCGAVVSGIITVLMTAGGGVMLVLGFLVGFFALATGPRRPSWSCGTAPSSVSCFSGWPA